MVDRKRGLKRVVCPSASKWVEGTWRYDNPSKSQRAWGMAEQQRVCRLGRASLHLQDVSVTKRYFQNQMKEEPTVQILSYKQVAMTEADYTQRYPLNTQLDPL